MEIELASMTIRLPLAMKLALLEEAKKRDLTVSQLVRHHFTEKYARRVSAATDSAARRATPRKTARKGAKAA